MGTDLYVSEQSDFRIDDEGRSCYTVTNLHNFRHNSGIILENLSDLFFELGNCCTKTVDAIDFIECLHNMEEQLAKINSTGIDEYNSKTELEDGIEELEWFIKDNNIDEVTERGYRTFEVHLWY